MPDMLGVLLEIGMSDDDLIKRMRAMREFRETHEDSTITAAIRDFDNDPRELWAIPEVKTFARRLMDLGFISMLDAMPDPDQLTGPLYAVHIWLLAQGKMGPHVEINYNEFVKALDTANRTALIVEGRDWFQRTTKNVPKG